MIKIFFISFIFTIEILAFDPISTLISGITYVSSVVHNNNQLTKSEISRPLRSSKSEEISNSLVELVNKHSENELRRQSVDVDLSDNQEKNSSFMDRLTWWRKDSNSVGSSGQRKIKSSHKNEKNKSEEVNLIGIDITKEVLSMDEIVVGNLAKVILEMEVLGVLKTLRQDPYVLHGLLQDSPEAIMEFNRDTSHGYFGFTLGTFGETYAILKRKPDGGTSMLVRDRDRIIRIQRVLISTFDIPNLPFPQIASFYGLVQGWYSSFESNKAAVRYRRLTDVEMNYVPQKYRKDLKFNFLCVFYRMYNGQLSQSKVDRLKHSFEKYMR